MLNVPDYAMNQGQRDYKTPSLHDSIKVYQKIRLTDITSLILTLNEKYKYYPVLFGIVLFRLQ